MKRDLRENLLKYNDYELLYMNGLSSEEARDILFEKYIHIKFMKTDRLKNLLLG